MWSGIFHPQSLSSDSIAPVTNMYLYALLGQVPKAASLSLFKARWACPLFHWYNHLAAIFVPSVGLEDSTAHIEALAKFT